MLISFSSTRSSVGAPFLSAGGGLLAAALLAAACVCGGSPARAAAAGGAAGAALAAARRARRARTLGAFALAVRAARRAPASRWRRRSPGLAKRIRGPVFRRVFRQVCRSFPAAGWCLRVECFRYRLPNFPHSPAGYGRERQRLAARSLRMARQAALLFRSASACPSWWRPPGTAGRETPATRFSSRSVSIHPRRASSSRMESASVSRSSRYASISRFHSRHLALRRPRVSVPGQIDEVDTLRRPGRN